MESNKKSASAHEAPIPAGQAANPVPFGDYNTSAFEAQKALQTLYSFLPDDLKSKFVRGGGFKSIQEWLSSTGACLPPEIEAKLFNLSPIPSSQIMETEYPPLPELVPGLLFAGLSYLIGKPKIGKSWLGMQLACAVMTGGKIFERDVQQGRVLYFALEDSERRLQKRMVLQKWPVGDSVDFVLFDEFQSKIGALNSKENSSLLLKYIRRMDYRLVIVDTFSRAILGDQLKADEMTDALGPIQYYALSSGVSFIIVDHMPKNVNPGDFDAISHVYGSVAKAGVADTSWALYREKGQFGGTVLAITGREMEEQNLKLRFDKELHCWQSEGQWSEVRMTAKRRELLDILGELGPVKALTLTEVLGDDLSNVIKKLKDLIFAGLVEKREDGTYQVIKKN